MVESAITSKGQTTLPKEIRKALGVTPGDRVAYVVLENKEVRILPLKPISRMFGRLKHKGAAVTLEQMQEAIARGASDG